MIVATYWAEARKQQILDGKQITLRRFGWSDENQTQAEAMANERATEALNRVVAGERLMRREPKVAYNGAEGVPIREEILERHASVVITRNSYGAQCLNSPDVLIADVDTNNTAPWRIKIALFLILFAAILIAGIYFGHTKIGFILGLGASLFSSQITDGLFRLKLKIAGGPINQLKSKLQSFLIQNPDWSIRLYQTPAGFRLIVTQQNFQPSDEFVDIFFTWVGADPMYTRMCKRQACFRARLTAKPWRIGLKSSMKPRPGVWPVATERQEGRRLWIEHYEQQAANFAACCFLESVGSGIIAPQIADIIALHDLKSKALNTALPLA